MRKIIPLLFTSLLVLTGCTTANNPGKEKITEVSPIATYDEIVSLMPSDVVATLYNTYGGIDTNTFKALGKDLTKYKLMDYEGNEVSLSDIKGQVVLEVVANWCGYCQAWTKEQMATIEENNKDIKFIQVFAEGGKEDIDAFYEAIETEMPADRTVIPNDEAVNELIKETNVASFPTFIFVDNGKVTWSATGYMEEDAFKTCLGLAFGEKAIINSLSEDFFEAVNRSYTDIKEELNDTLVAEIDALNEGSYFEDTYDVITYTDLAKNVSLKDFETIDGKEVTAEMLEGKNILLIGTAAYTDENDIYYHRNNTEVLKNLLKDRDDIAVIEILLQYSEVTPAEFYEENPELFTGYVIETTNAKFPTDIYNLSIFDIPTMYFINTEGKVAGIRAGSLTTEKLNDLINLYFGETPIYKQVD